MTVRVRFAPSPTGHLHIGGARTALFNYLFARKMKGTLIVRIEDTDQKRNVADGYEGFLENLKWLGLTWEEGPDVGGGFGPYTCMERLDIYQTYVDRLLAEGKAYYCYCSEEQLEEERGRMLASGQIPRYGGRCRHLSRADRDAREAARRTKSVRFRTPDEGTVTVRDRIRGEVAFACEDIGDFVIVKSDGIPTYNFAVVIDDRLMGITHVIRGEEHLSNTPRQALLYDSLNWERPVFAHLPLILSPNGGKLSKRDGSIVQFIEQYRRLGYLPEAIVNFAAHLGWSPGDEREFFTMPELTEAFSLERIGKSGAVFDTAKLDWMSGYYMKHADVGQLAELALPFLTSAGLRPELRHPQWIKELVSLYQGRMVHLSELPSLSAGLWADHVPCEEEPSSALDPAQAEAMLAALLAAMGEASSWTFDEIGAVLKMVEKETGSGRRLLFQTIRYAVSGNKEGPDLQRMLELLGPESVRSRLVNFIEAM